MQKRLRWSGSLTFAAVLAPWWLGCTPTAAPRTPLAPGAGSEQDDPPPTEVASEAASWPRIALDEVLPANASRWADEHGDRDDWIDLYNPGSEAVDLAGWTLSDGGGADWAFPTATRVAPGAHLVVWADGEPGEGPLHAALGLSRDGETLTLSAPDGSFVDRLTWPALPDDVVWGRFPSGSPFESSSIVATPWTDNPFDPGLSTDPSDALFPEGGVIRLELWVEEEALDALRVDREAVVAAGLAFEEAWLYPVGLGLKGGMGSVRSVDEKTGFRVDTDRFVPGLELRGLEHLTLNNLVQDRSTVNQMLSYALFRDAGVPAPRVAHVELWMNGEYRGLYLNVEAPDEDFLRRWFEDAEGNLYEGSYGDDLLPAHVERFEHDVVGAADVTDRSDLAALTEFFAQPPSEALMPELERRLDLDAWLAAMAGEMVVGHGDGYYHHRNNYRLYHEPSLDRWTLLPWGTDQTLSKGQDPWNANGLVGSFCLRIPSCSVRYDQALLALADRLAALGCAERVDAVWPLVFPLIQADPLLESTPERVKNRASEAVEFCETWPAQLEGWVR